MFRIVNQQASLKLIYATFHDSYSKIHEGLSCNPRPVMQATSLPRRLSDRQSHTVDVALESPSAVNTTLASLLPVLEAMNVGYVTAIAALAGAGLGGLTSFASSWTTLHAQMKAQRLASSKSTRQELYKQFIDEASRTYVDALVHDKLDVSGLVGIYALISRMRVLSSRRVIESASGIAILITDTYFQPNKSPTELQAMMHDGGVDPLRDFSGVCRQELETDSLA